MTGGKKPRSSASKISATTELATSATSQYAGKSSIFRSSFAPSHFQLAIFASVIQGFDSQQIRIHDTANGRLRCEHAIASKATISCLDWGYYGKAYREQPHKGLKKKRKRTDQTNGSAPSDNAREVVLAFGTSDSEIHLYSPAAAKIVGILKDVHTQGVRDFKFVDAGRHAEGWSAGGDGKTISLPGPSAGILCPFGSSVLCASHKVYLLDPDGTKSATSFTASNNFLHSIKGSSMDSSISTSPTYFLTVADTDRFINVFNKEIGASIGSLVAENDVIKIAIASNDEATLDNEALPPDYADLALAAINKEGVLEIFDSPFKFGSSSAPKEVESLKTRMKQRTRKAKAFVKVVRPDKVKASVPLLDAMFQDHELVLAWVEGGVDLRFDRLPWKERGAAEILLEGVHELVRGKGAAAVGAVVMNGVKDMGKMHVDESQAVVTTGEQPDNTQMVVEEQSEVINISSAEEETDYEDEDEELPERPPQSSSDSEPPLEAISQQGSPPPVDADVTMEDTDGKAQPREESAGPGADEPSFGEMIRANAPGPVDVQIAFAAPNAQSLAPTSGRQFELPSGMSLGTVLTQSLRTNDVSLLETCLHVHDHAIVRATIERLDSSLASTLVQKLAERFHSRPGRAGSLLIWIQWTMVAHGGYLASQPGAMKTLAALHRVISERARSLPLLLSLKGKLDMLESQMNLRASMHARSKAQITADEDDEDNVIYVEGQEEDDSMNEAGNSDADDVDMDPSVSGMAIDDVAASGEDTVNGKMPAIMPNGAFTDSDDDQSSGEGFFDEEAESTDQDSGDEGSLVNFDHTDVDSIESDASTEAGEVPPSKRPAIVRLSNGVGAKK
ncbi:MAG: hypothetical protein Q9170_001602 [Blastenia crenularia]